MTLCCNKIYHDSSIVSSIHEKRTRKHEPYSIILLCFCTLLTASSLWGQQQLITNLPITYAFKLPKIYSESNLYYRRKTKRNFNSNYYTSKPKKKTNTLWANTNNSEEDEFSTSSSSISNKMNCFNNNETVSDLVDSAVMKERIETEQKTNLKEATLSKSWNTAKISAITTGPEKKKDKIETTSTLTMFPSSSADYRNKDVILSTKQWQQDEISPSIPTTSCISKKIQENRLLKVAGIPKYRTMLVFISTTIIIWLSEPLLSLVDTTVVGRYASPGEVVLQLASLGPATMLIDNGVYMTYFLCIATTNQIAKGLASKKYALLQSFASQVLGLAGIMGMLITTVVYSIGRPLLRWTAGASASNELIQLAWQYCQIRSVVAPLVIIDMVAQSLCLATLDIQTPALAVLAASIVNIVGDLLFVPKFGMQGAAVATAVASISSGIILLRRVKQIMAEWQQLEGNTSGNAKNISMVIDGLPTITTTTEDSITVDAEAKPHPLLSLPSCSRFKQLISITGPILGCNIGKIICYSAMTMRSATFGVADLAAHNVMLRVFFFFATFGDSVGNAAQTFLPRVLSFQKLRQKSFFAGTTINDTTSTKQQLKSEEVLFVPVRHLFRRLLIVAGGVGLWNKLMAQVVLQTHLASRLLTSESSILNLLQSSASTWAGWALLLHPFIMVLEGSLLATQDLSFLLKSYMLTMGIHFMFLHYFCCNSFSNVWRTLCLFQILRVVQFTLRTIQTVILNTAPTITLNKNAKITATQLRTTSSTKTEHEQQESI